MVKLGVIAFPVAPNTVPLGVLPPSLSIRILKFIPVRVPVTARLRSTSEIDIVCVTKKAIAILLLSASITKLALVA
jgi:hypothetical protein